MILTHRLLWSGWESFRMNKIQMTSSFRRRRATRRKHPFIHAQPDSGVQPPSSSFPFFSLEVLLRRQEHHLGVITSQTGLRARSPPSSGASSAWTTRRAAPRRRRSEASGVGSEVAQRGWQRVPSGVWGYIYIYIYIYTYSWVHRCHS